MNSIINKNYEILKTLVKTNYNEVYLAKKSESDDQNRFLIKTIKPLPGNLHQSFGHKQRFKREIDFISSLEHENISEIVDSYSDSERQYIVFEHLEGQPFSEIISSRSQFDLVHSLNLVRQIVVAQEYIHSRGIIHCDINPNNIYVTRSNVVKIFDFGLSLTVDEARSLPEGKLSGTIPYVAPEQLGLTDFKVDNRSDLFSTAIILYRMLSGFHPFEPKNNTVEECLDLMLKTEIQPIKQIPESLNRILLKALKPTPGERYQTAGGLLYDIHMQLIEIENGGKTTFLPGNQDKIISINREKLFVSRESELKFLNDQVSEKHISSPRSVVFYGKSGSGKSELIREFFERQSKNKILKLSTKSNKFTNKHPFSVFKNIVLQYLHIQARDNPDHAIKFKKILNSELSAYSSLVVKIIPEMNEYFDNIQPAQSVKEENEAERLIHIMYRLFSIILRNQKTFIFIDDFQWIDHTSYTIVKKVLSSSDKGLLILNFRTKNESNELYIHKEDIRTLPIQEFREVTSFEREDIQNFLEAKFGQIPNMGLLVDSLYKRTTRTPLEISESIRFLVNNSILKPDSQSWYFEIDDLLGLPEKFNIVDFILKKIHDLNPDSRRYLEIASLLEGSFEPEIIEQVGDFTGADSKLHINNFIVQGFISRDIKSGYSFTHDKVQETIGASLEKEDLFNLHEQIGLHYAGKINKEPQNVLPAAEHYQKSKNLEKANLYTEKAADYSSSNFDLKLAIEYYKQALLMAKTGLIKNIKPAIDIEETEKKLGNIYILAGQHKPALKIFLNLHKQIEKIGSTIDSNNLLQIKYKLGTIYKNRADFPNAMPYYLQCLNELKVFFPTTTIGGIMGLIYEFTVQFAVSPWLKKLRKPEKNKHKILTTAILNDLTYSYFFQNMTLSLYSHFKALNLSDLLINCHEKIETYGFHIGGAFQMLLKKRAYRYIPKITDLSNALKRSDLLGTGYSYAGTVYCWDANWKKSLQYLDKSLDTCKQTGNLFPQLLTMEHKMIVARYQGDFDQFPELLTYFKFLNLNCDDRHYKALCAAYKCLYSALNGIEVNQEDEQKIIKIIKDSHDPLSSVLINILFSEIYLVTEDLDKAESHLKAAEKTVKKYNIIQDAIISIYTLNCEIAIQRLWNQMEKSDENFTAPKKIIKTIKKSITSGGLLALQYPAHRGSLYRAKGWLKYFNNQNKKAEKLFQKAITYHHKKGMKLEEAKSHRDIAKFYDLVNLPGFSKDEYQKAATLFLTCSSPVYAERMPVKNFPHETQAIYLDEQPLKTNSLESFPESNGVNQIHVNTLLQVSSSITELQDIDKLLKQIVQALIKATGAQNGLLLLQENQNLSTKTLLMNFEGKELENENINYSPEIINWVSENKQPMVVKNGEIETRVHIAQKDKVRSVLCLPLQRNENFFGCIYLSNDRISGLFSKSSEKAAIILAAQACVLLENAYLLNNYIKLNSNLEYKVKEQTANLRAKHEELGDINLKLIESERMKGILTGTLVHDIKNYVAGVEGNLKVLKRQLPNDDSALRSITTATNACTDIASLSSNLLDIGKMEEGHLELKLQPISYEAIFNIINNLVQSSIFDEKNITVNIKQPASRIHFNWDFRLLERLLQNLFNNAAKYTPKSGTVEVSIDENDKNYTITIFNSGSPIEDKFKESLFDKYARAGEKWSAYSKGLGLFFCRMVVQAHEGKIWVDTNEKGNYFRFTCAKAEVAVAEKIKT